MVVLLLACGGYGPTTTLAELEPEQRLEVCEGYAFDAPVDEDCGSPIPLDLEPLDPELCADLWMPEGCPVTVSEWEACQAALADEPCAVRGGHPDCDALEACGVHLWANALGLRGDLPFQRMAEADILAVCEVTNDFEDFSVPCEEGPPIEFEASPELCASFGFGGCGTIGDVLDCQEELFVFAEDLCDGITPEACSFTECS